MRFLSFHCDYFKFKTTKKSRSKIIENLTKENKENAITDVIVLFISIEKQDESNDIFLKEAIKEIKKISKQLKVSNIVLLSFAHLFGELSSPKFGFKALRDLESMLWQQNFRVIRPPFGWFNELEFKAKGHPLSRMSRRV